MRMESDASTSFLFMTFCQTVCPWRDKYQLMKTFAAFGWGARLINASTLLPPPPIVPPSFKIFRGDVDDGQSLLRRFVDFTAQMTYRKFAGGQPIGSLAPVAKQRDVGLRVKPPQEIGAETGAMVKNQHRRQQRRAARILAEKFSFPFGLKQIPIRLDFVRTHELGIDRKSRASQWCLRT